jgi:N4-gp56 family major capsid protein
VSYKDFVYAIATLELNNAQPGAGSMVPVIMGPLSFAELMNDATFVALFSRTGGEQMYQYKMGTILNAEIYVTSNVRTYVDGGASNADPASMLFIGKGAYGLAGMQNAAVDYVQDPGGEHGNNTTRSVRPVDIIMKGLGDVGNDPLNQRGSIGWKATHDAKILNSAWVVDLEHVHTWS